MLNNKKRLSLYLILTPFLFLLDQVTKHLALTHLKRGLSVDVIGNFLRFSIARNPGGMFSTRIGNNNVYIILGLVGVVFIIFYAVQLFKRKNIFYDLGIPFLLSGAFGNITDRFNHALVTDFIDVGIGPHRWPTFNIADSAILIGLSLIFIAELKFNNGKDNKIDSTGRIPENKTGPLPDPSRDSAVSLEDTETNT